MRILFMGTPEISALCLKRLVADGYDVICAVTGEDKPRGRKMQLTPTAVKLAAQELNIPVITPKTLRGEEFMAQLTELSPDIIVVVAYGKILPIEVINYPKFGCVNLHVSLLPKYRGAAPMQRAIMDGESETGVTVMQMDAGLDTGDVISCERFPIEKDDDFEAVHDKSAEIGAGLLSKTLDDIFCGRAVRTPQDDSLASYAKKIEKSDAKIDFTKTARELDFIIRGTTPIPGAFAYLGDKMLKICKAEVVSGKGQAGEVISLDGGKITIACGEGALAVGVVIPEGKSKMSAADFIRGRKIAKGDILK